MNYPSTVNVSQAIITQLRKSLSKCCPPMVVSKDTEDTLELIGNKPVPYGSKKKIVPGMYFASFVARKDSVSLYFFAIYFHAKDYEKTIPNLGKGLRGKLTEKGIILEGDKNEKDDKSNS
jgi:hypothetical protein